MPGFSLHTSSDEDTLVNKPVPTDLVYSYTWSLESLSSPNGEKIQAYKNIYCRDCTLPEFSVETEEYQGPSVKYKYAKSIIWPDVKITFYDTTGILPTLRRLKSSVWSPETGMMTAASYKSNSIIHVRESDDDVGRTPAQVWTLYGSWLKGISWSPLSYATSEAHLVIVTLSYDFATMNDTNGVSSDFASSGGDF